ncbi:MAG: hypothetical protein M3010_12470 [Candidatus Dormibacteraeota bacterium]|nr:hypothetical protein [Candidatus Dormibacteraeota bacterium]
MPAPWRGLPVLTLTVDADPRLVGQLLGAVVTRPRGELAGHRYERLEAVSSTEAVVGFEVSILGRDFSTTERVVVDAGGISFTQLTGSVPAIEERIDLTPAGLGTRVRYSGRFQCRPGLLAALLEAPLVYTIYAFEGLKTLKAVKTAAEARQAKSAMFRRAAS